MSGGIYDKTVAGAKFEWDLVSRIPEKVLQAWPAWITFGIVGYVRRVIVSAVPNASGAPGMALDAVLSGMGTTINMVTWDVMKGHM